MHRLVSLRVSGVGLRCFDHGSGEPLLLLHGYPQSHASWRLQAHELARTHRVIAPDWFGWGASERSPSLRPEYGAEVDRIGELADALGLDRFNLAGHDYGGFLALGYAQRNAGRVSRLAILNSRAHRSFTQAFYRRTSMQCLMARAPVLRTLLLMSPIFRQHARALQRYVPSAFSEEILESYIGWMRSKEGRRWFVQFFRYYDVAPRPELAAGLQGLSLPTAVIWGEQDPFCDASIGHDLAQRVRGATLTLVPNAGHFVMEECPLPVLASLRRWLARPTRQS